MPGGRLTHGDRQDIASGLAERLGYAAIARRLGRPTSTISREVARNGGPDGYRADRAHQATERRSRRPGPPPRPESPAAISADGRDPEAVRAFAEEFAGLMVQTGLPRMVARVFARLFTTDSGRLGSAELVRQLRVSPASVSKAVGYLEGLELIRRERAPGTRRELYVIDDDVWIRSWTTSARTTEMWAQAARRGVDLFDAGTPAGARLDQMRQFFAGLSDNMSGGPDTALAADVLTVLAALVHTGAPLTAEQLATALDWPPDRLADALRAAEEQPDVTCPVALRRTAADTYAVAARPEWLTPPQREALGRHRLPGPRV
ncbi:GbsR/MarR family transcriptional regulator [Streptomyces milbemycinicus]|uniref:GbsR/MarR family transcriptional regulator n=1 Tax=Streptomyces milbemycinicus TaxID=476552 RepID=UPI0033CC5AD3